jgi:hypothetical protein
VLIGNNASTDGYYWGTRLLVESGGKQSSCNYGYDLIATSY